MSKRECYWQSAGPTMYEMSRRAELIGECVRLTLGAEFAGEIHQPFDRATVVVRGMDFVGEYPLMTEAEKAAGHWVRADEHSDNCELAPLG